MGEQVCVDDGAFAPDYRWLSIDSVVPDMVLARRVVGHNHGRVTLMLAPGTVLTAMTITQLILNGVECVAVLDEQPMAASDYLLLKQAYEARLREIFAVGELQPSAGCQPIFAALMAVGPQL